MNNPTTTTETATKRLRQVTDREYKDMIAAIGGHDPKRSHFDTMDAIGATWESMPGRVGRGNKIHSLSVRIVETETERLIVSAYCCCGSACWSMQSGQSGLQVFEGVEVTCKKCRPDEVELTDLQKKRTTATAFCPTCNKRVKVRRSGHYRCDADGNHVKGEDGRGIWDKIAEWNHGAAGHVGTIADPSLTADTPKPEATEAIDPACCSFDAIEKLVGERGDMTVAEIADALIYDGTATCRPSNKAERLAVKKLVQRLVADAYLVVGPKKRTTQGPKGWGRVNFHVLAPKPDRSMDEATRQALDACDAMRKLQGDPKDWAFGVSSRQSTNMQEHDGLREALKNNWYTPQGRMVKALTTMRSIRGWAFAGERCQPEFKAARELANAADARIVKLLAAAK